MNNNRQRHIILKQIIELNVPLGINAFRLQNSASESYYVSALNLIESVFNKINTNGQNIRIEKLEIDLGNVQEDEILNKTWLQKFPELLEKEVNKESAQLHSQAGNTTGLFEQWIFYIQHGYLPWNASGDFSKDYLNILKLIRMRNDYADRLRRFILKNPNVCERVVFQHGNDFVFTLISIFSETSQEVIKISVNEILKLSRVFSKAQKTSVNSQKEIILQEMLKLSCENIGANIGERHIINWLNRNVTPLALSRYLKSNRTNLKNLNSHTIEVLKKIDKIKSRTSDNSEEDTIQRKGDNIELNNEEQDLSSHLQSESIFVKYAGLILLHSFLKPFFKNLKLILENDFVDEDSKIKAIGLLNFLATGKTFADEHELVIAKILCNYPIEKVIGRTFKLSKSDKKEANTLLEELIRHWSVLKNTSKEGLQESFLCRNGMITEKDGNIYLKMETSAIDILLEYYPANIGVVKLPWRKEMLFVEWR